MKEGGNWEREDEGAASGVEHDLSDAGLEAREGGAKKSKGVAVVSALVFGPLGLLYLGLEGMMLTLFIVGAGLFVLPFLMPLIHQTNFGLLVSLLVRAGCAAWAIKAVDQRNGRLADAPDAENLLDEATRLESIDLAQALAKYKEVVDKFPDSRSAKVAKSCIETMQPQARR